MRRLTSNLSGQRRLKSACASAQSDQSCHCQHKETLHHWLSKMRPAKILIRLRECADRSESSPGAHIRMYVFLWRSFILNDFYTVIYTSWVLIRNATTIFFGKKYKIPFIWTFLFQGRQLYHFFFLLKGNFFERKEITFHFDHIISF